MSYGFDPMIPDKDGNTFLHLLAHTKIKRELYKFIMHAVVKYKLKLSRNFENKTPIDILKKYSAHVNLNGEPNYKLKLWEWLEYYNR